MRRFPKRPGDQRGSVTVFVALLLPTLMVMVFLTLNIGQLVFEKIRLQNTADACALSAAAAQAAGLNEIAEVNFWSQDYVYPIAKAVMAWSEDVPWRNESTANSAVRYYKGVFRALRRYQDDANTYYANKAMQIAKVVKMTNYDDIGIESVRLDSINPRSSLKRPGKLLEYETHRKTVSYAYVGATDHHPCSISTALSWSDLMAGPENHFSTHMGATPVAVCGKHHEHTSTEFEYRISKKSSPTTYAAFKLTQESKDFVVAGSIFGKMQKMEAYAAALPTKGDVKKGKPDYVAVLVRLDKLDPRPDAANLDKVLH